ncbi:MAG: hypothetical protein ABI675_11535 [Chitinophagaceae bacterium]
MYQWKYRPLIISAVFFAISLRVVAQNENEKKESLDSMLLRQKGIIGQLAKNLVTDTLKETNSSLQRNDLPFQKYSGKVIRNITIQTLEFGVPITDTSQRTTVKLKRLANKLHHDTREYVIRNNLFFSKGEILSPYLLGDNEKHLRDLPFLLDAKIRVIPVNGSKDSVDILVLSKDVLSIGGSFRIHSSKSLSLALSEDNFGGWGDEIEIKGLIDADRSKKLGYGFEYSKRNMGGSFVNASIGFLSYNKAFSTGEREEDNAYLRITRPLVNRFMKWTYGAEMEWHKANNYYREDSLYQQNFKYKYNIADTWGAWNLDADKTDGNSNTARSRRLIGLRVLHQNFFDKPLKYTNDYFYAYADKQAVLGDFSLFRQNFYRTRYIYGFGRNEDVPEGMEASLTAGWTKIDGRERAYTGINFSRYFFTPNRDYLNFSIGSGGYLYKNKFEDIDLLSKVDFFTRLHQWKRNWKQRFFLGSSVSRQFKNLLSEPLKVESDYGLGGFRNNSQPGNFRLAVKGESVFYSPWSVLLFRFAPFVFVNSAVFHERVDSSTRYNSKLYSSIGAGVRIRNESLIFGTIEFKGMYFPRKNFFNESWRFEARSNIRFKYNQQFIKRPEFIKVN